MDGPSGAEAYTDIQGMNEVPMAAGIALISAAGAALLRARFGSGAVMRAGFVTAVVTLGLITATWFVVTPRVAAEYLARMGAIIAAVMSICAAGVQWTLVTDDEESTAFAFVRVTRHLALLFGVLAGTVLAIVLGVRCIYVAVELLTVLPTKAASDYGFTREGAGSLALLLVACAVCYGATMASGLSTCIVVLATMIGVWLGLAGSVLNMSVAEGMTRSLGFALVGPWLAIMMMVMAIMTPKVMNADGPVATPVLSVKGHVHGHHAGWRVCCAALALGLMLHTVYPLVVPMDSTHIGMRMALLIGCLAALVGSLACMTLARELYSGNLADGAFGLMAIAVGSLAVSAVPGYPLRLVEMYPLVFNALIVGLALGAAVCALLARHWTLKSEVDPHDTGAAMLRFHAKRGIFICGAAGVVIGGMMAFWPRLPGIAVSDFSLVRVSVGFAANLLLFLVMLVCARMYLRPTYYVLSGLAFVSAVTFMLVRMLPYTPRFG